MLYMSNDRKEIFKTELECLEYERKLEEEKIKQEQLEVERQDRFDSINKQYEKLQELISEYEKDYGVRQKIYFLPLSELMNMLGA